MLADWCASFRQFVLLALVTLALVATGFAHRMPTQASTALELALASGFAVSDLCNGGETGEGHAGPNCLACQIAGAADLPASLGDLLDIELVLLARITAPRESRLVRPVLDRANSPQAPPVA